MPLIGVIKEIWRYPVKSMAGEQLTRSMVGAKGVYGDRGWALRDEQAKEIRGAKKMPQLLLCSASYREEPSDARIPHAAIQLPDGVQLGSDHPEINVRLSALLGRTVTLWPQQPASNTEHYRRGVPDNPDLMLELRELFGRTPDEPIPDLSVFPKEIFEFTSPPGTYFDAFPLHLLTTATLTMLAQQNPSARWASQRFRPNFVIDTAPEFSGLVENDWCNRTLRIGALTIQCSLPTPRCVMTTLAQPGLEKDPSVLRTIVREANQNVGVYATVLTPGQVSVGDTVELLP
ncbi:MAG TPA: MOSC N-terminal beta barrel domain-containing protein [Methylomirabilota bacterium]|jgi:uncharacterized protein YcbX|nr:MOSC N-terminal beta barrel domain-containing protein [Methylomirabilota bacterium]